MHKRIQREEKTISLMIAMYCKAHHRSQGVLCESCNELEVYARKRAAACRFGKNKPPCADCPVHCYKKDMRERVKEIMRYAGPRMMWKYPYYAVMHIVDKVMNRKRSLTK